MATQIWLAKDLAVISSIGALRQKVIAGGKKEMGYRKTQIFFIEFLYNGL